VQEPAFDADRMAALVALRIPELDDRLAFPPLHRSGPDGLLAVGGDLRPERLVAAYSQGIFPWPHDGLPLLWFSPDPRMVLDPRRLHVGRSLRARIQHAGFELRFDTAFRQVMEACASAPRPGQQGTWITPAMIEAYCALHARGLAHSAEAWRAGRLVGGLYGVSLGRAFFGESMFTRESDASKVAFVGLVQRLGASGFQLVDCQMHTPHLARFGAVLWSRVRYLEALRRALRQPTLRGRWLAQDDGLVAQPPAEAGRRSLAAAQGG